MSTRPDLARPVLVQALDGFVDAGSGRRLAREHLLNALDSEPLVTFDVDQLVDYRSRRPEMTFTTDHWVGYAAPELAVHVVRDPVCGTFVLPEHAVTLVDGRTRLYFCSEACRDKHRAHRESVEGRTA